MADNDINKSNSKNVYHLLPHAKSAIIASYYRERTNDTNNKDCEIRRSTL